MISRSWRDATRTTRAGLPEPSQGDPLLPGPIFASKYHLRGDPASSPYSYGRYHNPTWTSWEHALSDLEGGAAVSFASGMAAITALLSVALLDGSSPKVLVMPSDGYYGARKLAGGFFASLGVEIRSAQTRGDAQLSRLDGANLLWLESPSNPSLDVCNLPKLVAAAHERGVLVAVDNTTATVLGQSPMDLGADFSVSSDSKVLTGHGDLVLGHVTARDSEWADRLRAFRSEQGAIPGPMEAWLAHRSLATLDVRFERQCGNALEIARFLSKRPEVGMVRYPGLPSDPAFPIASRQMKRFGPVVSFVLDGKEKADNFLERCSLVLSTTSFGGVHTTAERRARWGGDTIPDGFIRLSAGCEDIRDILQDLDQALSDKPPV